MGKSTKYASKIPDDNGFIQYSDEENRIWSSPIVGSSPAPSVPASTSYELSA